MWKIKDPELKRKMNQFISDAGINEVCRNEMADSSTYIFFSFEDDAYNFRIDKSYFEEVPRNMLDVWKPFPQVTPKSESRFLVTARVPTGGTTVTVSQYTNVIGWHVPLNVIAFREFPKPYKEHDK